MNFDKDNLSQDQFLDGKMQFYQPKQGYRAATDAMFLAASIPAKAGQSVLELGCGAGVALGSLCFRVPGLRAYGVEIQNNYAELANQNFRKNKIQAIVFNGDFGNMPTELKALNFDHVMANPPFFAPHANTAPQDMGRRIAHLGGQNTTKDWVEVALRRLKPKGILTLIHRAEALPEIIAEISKHAGDIKVLPVSARQGRPAGRVIVQARKASRGPMVLLAPFVVHHGAQHGDETDRYSDLAAGILRRGDALQVG